MTLEEVGVRLTAKGEAEYIASLKSATSALKSVQLQSQLAVAQLGNNAKITDTYKTKMSGLGKELIASKDKTSLLRAEQAKLKSVYEKLPQEVKAANDAYKNSAKETSNLKKKYEELNATLGENHETTQKAKTEWENSKKATSQLKKEYSELAKELKNTEKELNSLPDAITKSELATQKLRNEAQKLHEEYRNNGGRLADTAKKYTDLGEKMQTVGDKLTSFGQKATTKFTLPIVAGLGLATKEAAQFQTEIGQMGPLLAGGGKITGEVKNQMQELSKTSRELAIGYGKHTSELNAGMSELIRNGYTAEQVMGVMPAMLNASLASGESFNAVMTTSSQVLSQFNLKGANYNETLKNSARVTDSLTYIANATASGFTDLGEGMSYVGPVAHSLNMSVEETAAILGVLSNKGIEASQGGTALRGALTRLLKPSKQNAKAMAELGFSADEFKNGTLKLPDIIDRIKENTKGWTDEQRAAAIAMAFGTEAQTAMNALVNEGGDSLRTLAKEAANASGATKEIADSMRELPEFKFQQMTAQLRDLGIEVGSKVLPYVLKGVEAVGKWVDAFNDLDEGTQNFIITAALVVAAIGPIATTLGNISKVAGMATEAFGGLVKLFGKMTTPKVLAETADGLMDIAEGATSAGASASLFSNPWVIAGAAATAAVIGFVAYMNNEAQAPFKAHNESVRETEGAYQEWFDAVTTGAKSIDELNNNAKKNADETTENYKEQVAEVMKANKEVQDMQGKMWSNKDWWSNLGYNNYQAIEVAGKKVHVVFDDMRKKMHELGQEDAFDKIIPKIQNYTTTLGNSFMNTLSSFKAHTVITEEWASGQIRAISTVSNSVVENLEQQKQAKIEAKRQQQVDLGETEQWLAQETATIEKEYSNRQAIVTNAQNNISGILRQAYQENRTLTQGEVLSMMKSYQQLAESAGQSLSTIPEAMNLIGDNMSLFVSSFGLDFLVASGVIDEATAKMIASMGTTEEKTNALKKALEGVSDIHPTAEVTVNGEEALQQLVSLFGTDWASLPDEQKEALVNAYGTDELDQLLFQYGIWKSESDLTAKRAVLETEIPIAELSQSIELAGLWNNAEFVSKLANIDTNAPDAKQQIMDLMTEFGYVDGKTASVNVTDNGSSKITIDNLNQFMATVGYSDGKNVVATVSANNAKESTQQVQEFGQAADNNSNKTVSVTSNLIGMVANLVTLGLYKTASDGLTDKSVTATTNVPSMTNNTSNITNYNKVSGEMKNTSATASTNTPAMPANTNNVKQWNSVTSDMKNRSSTATTSTPGIAGNTAAVRSWVAALNSSYSKTSVLTTYVDKVYRTFGRHATGGHIGAFAEGGNVSRWGGAFANGGNVPIGYTGLVGEAGPEIFQVTKRGVSITPLSTNEKMKGIADVIKENSGGETGQIVNINVNIYGATLKETQDIEQVAREVGERLDREFRMKQLFNKGRLA